MTLGQLLPVVSAVIDLPPIRRALNSPSVAIKSVQDRSSNRGRDLGKHYCEIGDTCQSIMIFAQIPW